ncbi:Zinc dependent phospholipase C [Rosistilla carotiformis]|uniref:Zinc dependent phospholipase C n=1 Tax=Rosistilla carotiformis TaxID=2528017 RepID=A0A518JXQ3_9BACT|nr:DUF4332 domain-containing protein [Rosistilla carotiformis]QDV70322.1 Zinc dependent phospholipase C [Rosistilla carotiformis]
MSQILTILRAAHCRSTHHYFALDALRCINTERGGRLADILLKHYDQYLKGAKDPDAKFRDFQNHVLHVGDGGWGGATRACEKWLKTAVNHLNSEEWEYAAYDLGVLSHYFTDPIMPLHTGSSDPEGVVHRPLEWSVCQSYESLYERWKSGKVRVQFQLPEGNNWITQAVTAGAERSHVHYHRIIEIYDLERGVKSPPEGLNAESREILSEMFGIAITGWARILERVAEQATCKLPNAGLTAATLVAAIDMPVAWIIKKIASVQEKAAVAAIFEEFQTTGTVRVHLPPEVRSVRTEMAMTVNRNTPINPPTTAPQPVPVVSSTAATAAWAPAAIQSPAPAMVATTQTTQAPSIATPSAGEPSAPAWLPAASSLHEPVAQEPAVTMEPAAAAAAQPAVASVPFAVSRVADSWSTQRQPSVSEQSDLVDAPSIGPKTAERFTKIGIHTIGQFLAVQPEVLAVKLETRWINGDLLADWQAQARLVCGVASLCGYKSQLLVAVDCRSVDQLAAEDAAALTARISDYCDTKAGERILRSSPRPEMEDVGEWIEDASRGEIRQAA